MCTYLINLNLEKKIVGLQSNVRLDIKNNETQRNHMISFILLLKICVTRYSSHHLRRIKYITSYIKKNLYWKNNTCAYKSK